MYEILLTKDALQFYEKAEITLVNKINRCFHQLEKNPFNHPNIKKLKGKLTGTYRFRLGDWRVVYRIDKPISKLLLF